MTDRIVSLTADGLTVADVTPLTLVCTAHPELDFGHDGCPGPGAHPSHRTRLLADLIGDLRGAALFGDTQAARWLERHGVDEFPWKEPTDG